MTATMTLYAVKSSDGKWYRSMGYGGHGGNWVEDIRNAKFYPKISNARRQVTYWSNHYPQYGVPQIVEFTVTEGKVIDERDRIEKAKKAKEIAEQARKKRQAAEQLKTAQILFERAQKELQRLQNAHL